MADYRSLEIKVSHARHLKNVNFLSDMETYVVVSLSWNPQNTLKTPVDRTGNKNPTWNNFSLKFSIDVASARISRPTLTFSLLCERALGNKPIGEVHVPLLSLLDSVDSGKTCHVAYQVRRPSGRGKGELSFSYQWGERSLSVAGASATAPPLPEGGKAEEEVMTAYPLVAETSSGSGYGPYGPYQYQTVPHGGGYQYHDQYPPPVVGYGSHTPPFYGGYPPPHQYGGYLPPSSPGYGYQAQTGYGHPPVRPAPRKSNKAGLGLGVGLLGGLLVGDLLF